LNKLSLDLVLVLVLDIPLFTVVLGCGGYNLEIVILGLFVSTGLHP
jgi:hypothetical protein